MLGETATEDVRTGQRFFVRQIDPDLTPVSVRLAAAVRGFADVCGAGEREGAAMVALELALGLAEESYATAAWA